MFDIKNYIEGLLKGREFFGQLDFIVIWIICLVILVLFIITILFPITQIILEYLWFKIGLVIAKKKYNNGCCGKYTIKKMVVDTKEGNLIEKPKRKYHDHKFELANYGLLILSRKFVKRKVCDRY